MRTKVLGRTGGNQVVDISRVGFNQGLFSQKTSGKPFFGGDSLLRMRKKRTEEGGV